MPITTKRLTLRPLQEGDGQILFHAIDESRANLDLWLPWPKHVNSWEDSEQFARQSYADYILRKSFNLGIFKDNELELRKIQN